MSWIFLIFSSPAPETASPGKWGRLCLSGGVKNIYWMESQNGTSQPFIECSTRYSRDDVCGPSVRIWGKPIMKIFMFYYEDITYWYWWIVICSIISCNHCQSDQGGSWNLFLTTMQINLLMLLLFLMTISISV